ncbi:hypothetical protein SELSPUOL_01528 [Selenomonas sputigena ATCC 35185]|uniref:Uncharacterized protein n=1 Tax=Selenomonas sputigena (strain ATCC 35185 / DSM 20758 / CCUG 44933 / VPI D19B-28) TaxID=546271 RepID=C9LVN6_SELS3|nr:hypothetical protein SELSPUOL_01528 [Selenomonas sputigena ATCC 35185]
MNRRKKRRKIKASSRRPYRITASPLYFSPDYDISLDFICQVKA